MIKIENEEQLNKFPWRAAETLGLDEPNALEVLNSGLELYYDGLYLFYNNEKNEKVIILMGTFTL